MSKAMTKQDEELALDHQDFHSFVDRTANDVVAALPMTVSTADLKRAKARLRVAFSMRSAGDDIFECTPKSVANCIAMSAITGLMPGGHNPDVDIIPRRNRKNDNRLELNWQISYRGYTRLARRAGYEIEPVLVFEGDHFDYEEGMYPKLEHKPNVETDRTWETMRFGYIRVFPIGSRDQTKVAFLTKKQIQQRRACAQSDVFWSKWPLEQTLKTLCRYAGQREMFPCDDPARYALQKDIEQDVGNMEAKIVRPEGGSSSLDLLAGATAPVALPATDVEVVDDEPDEAEVFIASKQVGALKDALEKCDMTTSQLLKKLGTDAKRLEELPLDQFVKAAKLITPQKG